MNTPAQVTEAHELLFDQIAHGAITRARALQLIADSEARAKQSLLVAYDVAVATRDQLRARCDKLIEEEATMSLAFQEQFARAETAEREVEKAKGYLSLQVSRAETAEREVERLKKIRPVSAFERNHDDPAVGDVYSMEQSNARLLESARDELVNCAKRAERAEAQLKQWNEAADASRQPNAFYDGYSEAQMRAMQAMLTKAESELAKLRGFYSEIVAECGHDLIVREYRQRGELLVQEANRRKNAEAILGKLQELHGCSQEMVVYWSEHAAKRSYELVNAQAELAKEREALRLERARLDWLEKLKAESNWNEAQFVWNNADMRIRAAIDAAMKEDAP